MTPAVARTVDVELLVVEDCPHEGATALLLRRALNDVGLSRSRFRTTVVRTPEEAVALRFVGSPTVRINGRDVLEPVGRRYGLACRVYQTEAGRSGTPDLTTLRRELKRHADHHA